MKIASHHTPIISAAALLVADALFFSFTNAASVTSVALIIGYGLATLTCYLIVYQLLRLSALYGIKLGRHRRRFAAVITGVAAAVLALITVGQFTVRDLLVITPLIIIGAAYISISRRKALSAAASRSGSIAVS